MTLRIPKQGTGSAWSERYWTPPEHPEIPLLLSLAPATRRWLFDVPGAGAGFCWTLPDSDDRRKDTDREWGEGDYNLACHAATGKFYAGLPLPDDADVDRALWLPTNPWAVLEALGEAVMLARWTTGEYHATWMGERGATGNTAIEAVLRLADLLVGKKGGS